MFGKLLKQGKQIVEGWTNYALGKEQELSEARMKICRECPLYNKDTDRCDARKCWDTINNKLVSTPGKGIICGCGCVMRAATKSINIKCVLSKW